MALRWDLRPVFPNAPEDSQLATITRRSVISGIVAIGSFVTVAAQDLPMWLNIVIALGLIASFDAGDTRFPFGDEDEIFEVRADGVHAPYNPER